MDPQIPWIWVSNLFVAPLLISCALSPKSVPDGTSFQESERGCLIDENFGKTQPLMGSAGVKCSKVGTV
jgi:hypothetical protein